MERAKNLATAVAMAWPLAAFLVLAASAEPDSFDATSSQYGMNWPGDLPRTLGMAALETAVLALVLRPRSFRDSTDRLVLALALFAPWAAFNFMVGTHAGSIILAHASWLVFVCAGLVYGLFTVVAAHRKQPRSGPTAHR